MSGLVTIITPSYKSEKFISQTIESVLSQTYQNWEMIIVDDASPDNSNNIIEKYCQKDARIKLIKIEINSNPAVARNRAIKEAKGRYIAFLDADDIWMPNKLTRQIPIFENKKIGICICDSYFFNDKGIVKQIYKNRKPPVGSVFKELLGRYFISLETAIIRKSSLDSLDEWFDNRFNMIEEYDLFVRIGYKWNVGYVDEVLAKWRIHDDSWTWSYSKDFPIEREMMLKKLEKYIPDFLSIYSNEVYLINRTCDFENARLYWSSNEKKKARDLLKPYMYTGFKWYVAYMMAYFPYGFFKRVWKVFGGIA